MKHSKRIIVFLMVALLACAVCFSSCEDPNPPTPPDPPHTHNFSKVENDGTFLMKCDCGEVLDEGYRIQFVYAEDGSQADADIEVSWIDKDGNVAEKVKTDDYGYVEAKNLTDESYKLSVNHNTLPVINGVEYLFNESEFATQQSGVGLIIPLFAVHQPTNANDGYTTGRPFNPTTGEMEDTSNRYSIELGKMYVATLNGPNDQVWYDVQHEGFGDYTISAPMSNDLTVQFNKYSASIAYIPCDSNGRPLADEDVDKSVSNQMTYVVTYPYKTSQSTLAISAPDATSYPIQVPFEVSITYAPDDANVTSSTMVVPTHFATVPAQYDYYTTEYGTGKLIPQTADSLLPAEGVAKCKDVENSVINDISQEQLDAMQKGDDGYYYTADNKLVYAKINTSSIFFVASTTIANYGESGQFGIYNISQYDKYGCRIRWDNYLGLAQAYTALTNSDGLYPLTEELIPLLESVVEEESASNLQHYLYEMLCTYATQIYDFSQGQGTQSNPYLLTLSSKTMGSYNVTIPEGQKVYLTVQGNMDITLAFNSNVKATVNDVVYSEYITVDGEKTVVLETKDGTALQFVLKVGEYDNPYYLNLGENSLTIAPDTASMYEFVATSAGTYDVSASQTVKITVSTSTDTTPIDISGKTYTFTLAEGESLYFIIETELDTQVSYVIHVESSLETN